MLLNYVLIFSVSYFGSVLCLPRDCQDLYEMGFHTTAKYVIYPDKTNGIAVRCDMNTTTGGWTVIQRRESDSDFYKGWDDYQYGFGDLATNFWLGLLHIHAITTQSQYELRIDLTHANGTQAYAGYSVFTVGDTESNYRLVVNDYHGNAGDSLMIHNGYMFTTKDNDNDAFSGNCATTHTGAWWYVTCHASNLNGDYGNNAHAKGVTWHSFTGYDTSLAFVEMKVRRFVPNYTGVGLPF